MRRYILACVVLILCAGSAGFALAEDPTPEPTTTPTGTPPGAGGAAEIIQFCAFEKEDGTFFCIPGSQNDAKCAGNYIPDVIIKSTPGFAYERKELKDCNAVPAPPKGYIEPERLTLCEYANSAHPTQVSCLQTVESMEASGGECPGICAELGLKCSSTKRKYIGECEYTGPPPQDIGLAISQLYTWSLRVLGLVVFGMFIYAGVIRFFSFGNPSKIGQSRDIMMSAVYGAVLLLAAVIILNAINPDLTSSSFSFPQVNSAPPSTQGAGSSSGSGIGNGGRSGGGGASGTF